MRPVQGVGLLGGEAEHEVFRKARGVALDLFIQPLGGDAVERGQVGIEDDALAVQNEYCPGDSIHCWWISCCAKRSVAHLQGSNQITNRRTTTITCRFTMNRGYSWALYPSTCDWFPCRGLQPVSFFLSKRETRR